MTPGTITATRQPQLRGDEAGDRAGKRGAEAPGRRG